MGYASTLGLLFHLVLSAHLSQAKLPALSKRKQHYGSAAIATSFLPAEMPLGRRTFQRCSLASTCKTTREDAGGWLTGASTSTKSGPKIGRASCRERV